MRPGHNSLKPSNLDSNQDTESNITDITSHHLAASTLLLGCVLREVMVLSKSRGALVTGVGGFEKLKS